LGLAVDDGLCHENLAGILDEAASLGVFVRMDMEGSAYTQKTLDVLYSLLPRYPGVGVVIQAALRRSLGDVQGLISRGARVRLCKGAYKEPAEIAFRDREEVNRSFDGLAEELLLRGTLPAFATHDDARAEHVKNLALSHGVSRDRFEFQMLYGLRPRLWGGLVKEGFRVRIYVPYGPQCIGYLFRRLRERKENLLFLLGSLWKG
jgi:proline dehydrogenase